MLVFTYIRFSSLFFSVMLLSACVTTNTGGTPPPNLMKAHDAHLNLGLTYLQKDNREAARKHLEKALSLRPDSAAARRVLGLEANKP